jgi:cytochrome c peroxidase
MMKSSKKTSLSLLLIPFALALMLLIPFALALIVVGGGNALAKGDPDVDPALAPLPPVPQPPDNKITKEKAALGKLLFFDPKLTGDASIGCGDCHDPKQGWGFNDPISRGYPGTVHWRNSQTVVNSGYLGKLFWQGSSKSLERQAPTANKGAVAGNGESDVMEARLRQTPHYIKTFKEVFGTELPNLGDAWMAIATFERAMLSQKDSPLDRYLKGDKRALSAKAVQGKKLFEGKANCIECHNGPVLSDEKYYNTGLPRPPEWEENGLNTITFRWENYAKGVHEKMYREWKDDAGLLTQASTTPPSGRRTSASSAPSPCAISSTRRRTCTPASSSPWRRSSTSTTRAAARTSSPSATAPRPRS